MGPEDKHDWKIRKLEQRAENRPEETVLRLDLAEVYFQKAYYFEGGEEWYERALAQAHSYLEVHPDTGRALDLVARCHFGCGRLDQAEEFYLYALAAEPEDALAMVGMGNLHRQRGNLSRAIEAFRQAVRLDGELWQAHYNLGDALYHEAKTRDFRGADSMMEEAIFHLVSAVRLDPFPGFLGNVYRSLGELFLYTRNYEQARRFFRKLVDHSEFGHIASYYLGLVYLSLNKPKNAIQYFRGYLAREPGSAIGLAKIALCHLELEEFERARAACSEALNCEPDNVMARFTLGCTDLAEGRYDAALASFKAILGDEPDYFPAYVEMVKARYLRGDYRWLFENLAREVRAFDQATGYDGGRRYYKGSKGQLRRRIDVLLAQIREIGLPAFGSLSGMLQDIQTDSLRFQIWEHLHELSRGKRIDDLLVQLAEPDDNFGERVGRSALMMSHYVPEDAIFGGFQVTEEGLRRRARSHKAVDDDIGAYRDSLDVARAELNRYRAYLLLGLAVKGTETAEGFLVERLDDSVPVLRHAAAVALLFYGNERAIAALEGASQEASGDARRKLDVLVEVGRSRREERQKVISLTVLKGQREAQRTEPQPRRRSLEDHENLSCSLCGRSQDQVERLMSGNRVLLCNLCISAIHDHRDDLAVPDDEEHSCQLCRRSVFEVNTIYRVAKFMLCNLCLDECVLLLRRGEVERFLKDFS